MIRRDRLAYSILGAAWLLGLVAVVGGLCLVAGWIVSPHLAHLLAPLWTP